MGYRPPVPWSRPDQDEPETWASWERRHLQRPAVHFQEDERREPEATVATTCLGLLVLLAAAAWLLHCLGVL